MRLPRGGCVVPQPGACPSSAPAPGSAALAGASQRASEPSLSCTSTWKRRQLAKLPYPQCPPCPLLPVPTAPRPYSDVSAHVHSSRGDRTARPRRAIPRRHPRPRQRGHRWGSYRGDACLVVGADAVTLTIGPIMSKESREEGAFAVRPSPRWRLTGTSGRIIPRQARLPRVLRGEGGTFRKKEEGQIGHPHPPDPDSKKRRRSHPPILRKTPLRESPQWTGRRRVRYGTRE
mmetsp:Transcript_43740/g.133075  ORF Transcript_43740/g.133075 Transcript_43740/m.133075 type:complete len:232 (+) Transcript_43740:2522-3217(+)